jgi:hypothetical protein
MDHKSQIILFISFWHLKHQWKQNYNQIRSFDNYPRTVTYSSGIICYFAITYLVYFSSDTSTQIQRVSHRLSIAKLSKMQETLFKR